MNAIDCDPASDRVLLTSLRKSEVVLFYRAPATREAAGPAGDILWRWGNPAAWGAGTAADQVLLAPHDGHWIPPGLPGAGNILIFNNGDEDTRPWSSVLEVAPDLDGAPGSATVVSEFVADPPESFFAKRTSGAQRLADGGLQVCDGPGGRTFRVDAAGNTVSELEVGVSLFRVKRLTTAHPGLAGRDLSPQGPLSDRLDED